ncbi:MAG: DUF1127 domain-containing protein [Burkholderiales bacterium]
MSTTPYGSHKRTPQSDGLSTTSKIWARLTAAWRHLLQRRAEAQRNRRDVQALSQVGDDQLRDIGLTRGQIETIVAGRAWQFTASKRGDFQSGAIDMSACAPRCMPR